MYKPRMKVVCTHFVQASLKHQNFRMHSQKEKTKKQETKPPLPPAKKKKEKSPNHTIISFWVITPFWNHQIHNLLNLLHDSVSGCAQKP